jgi:flagellar hook-length control protein FliK
MENLPVSPHIAVLSTSPSPAGEASGSVLPGVSTGGDGADFSSLLAGQIAAKAEALTGGKVEPEPLEAVKNAVSGPDGDAQDARADASQLVAFLPAIQLDVLRGQPQQGESDAEETPLGRVRAGLQAISGAEEHPEHSLLPQEVAAPKRPGLPANLAGDAPSLPGTRGAEILDKPAFDGVLGALATASQTSPQPADPTSTVIAHGLAAVRAEPGTASQAVPTVSVQSPVGTPEWGAEIGQKVAWLATRQEQIAHINVSPPQLGPIEIRLNLASDQASALFVSPHASVREAIEAALPRLRDMLAEGGLTLANVDVSAQFSGHSHGEPARHGNTQRHVAQEMGWAPEDLGAPRGGLSSVVVGKGRGLVDIFA